MVRVSAVDGTRLTVRRDGDAAAPAKKRYNENTSILAKEVTEMAKDPVCGMEVDEKKAPATSTYKSKTYYFCALGCKKAFDTNPEKFLTGAKGH